MDNGGIYAELRDEQVASVDRRCSVDLGTDNVGGIQ